MSSITGMEHKRGSRLFQPPLLGIQGDTSTWRVLVMRERLLRYLFLDLEIPLVRSHCDLDIKENGLRTGKYLF